MWILKFLPDWIFYFILLTGIVGYLVTYLIKYLPIPLIYIYKTPIQLVSICLIVIGTFMSGSIYNNNAWLSRVKEMEEKVAKAEEQSKQANNTINEKSRQKSNQIQQKATIVRQYIDREVKIYDNQCVIPKEFVKAINDASEPPK